MGHFGFLTLTFDLMAHRLLLRWGTFTPILFFFSTLFSYPVGLTVVRYRRTDRRADGQDRNAAYYDGTSHIIASIGKMEACSNF